MKQKIYQSFSPSNAARARAFLCPESIVSAGGLSWSGFCCVWRPGFAVLPVFSHASYGPAFGSLILNLWRVFHRWSVISLNGMSSKFRRLYVLIANSLCLTPRCRWEVSPFSCLYLDRNLPLRVLLFCSYSLYLDGNRCKPKQEAARSIQSNAKAWLNLFVNQIALINSNPSIQLYPIIWYKKLMVFLSISYKQRPQPENHSSPIIWTKAVSSICKTKSHHQSNPKINPIQSCDTKAL